MSRRKQKIAILGGGLGAMSAAFAITQSPNWQERYEITVYQMGWRLGGKGASGRNARFGQRIEEHGLHIWMGFYENGFRVMRACYEALERPEGAPLGTWREAFKPHSSVALNEFVDGQWVEWPVVMPVNDAEPGNGTAAPTPRDLVEMALQAMLELLLGRYAEDALIRWVSKRHEHPPPPWLELAAETSRWIGDWLERTFGTREHPAGTDSVSRVLAPLYQALSRSRATGGEMGPENTEGTVRHLVSFRSYLSDLAGSFLERHDLSRRLWILMDLGSTMVTGILKDDLIRRGLVAADDEEFSAWLRRHGASEHTLRSAAVRGVYNLSFAYRDGDPGQPDMGAGTALEIALRLTLTYKGAFMYKMQAGMGDTVFGPLYEVLRRRGVRFEFFHRVTHLGLDDTARNIESIAVDRQVDLVDETAGYQPLVNVKGLPCWPSEPRYEQIVDGAILREEGVNLESQWGGWRPVDKRTLTAGQDFDLVVLGISLGALPSIAGELLGANAAWRNMVQSMRAIRTQAIQLWFDPSLSDLGSREYGIAAGTYAEPLDTWADMSQLLAAEDWSSSHRPGGVVYLCGPLYGMGLPPPDETTFPERMLDDVQQTAITWLTGNAGRLWPNGSSFANAAGLDWGRLHAEETASGLARVKQQFLRANIDPSELYVQSVAGSTESRLYSGRSGFDNLFLAGDWVRTSLNAGCVESAVMGGLAASRAICGWPEEIAGWCDLDAIQGLPQPE